MKATIHFKNSAEKLFITVEGLTVIKATSLDVKSRSKEYTEEKFALFTPFAQESYSFTGSNGIFSVSGADILYVEIVED